MLTMSRQAESSASAASAEKRKARLRSGRLVLLLWALIVLGGLVAWLGRTERYVSADGRLAYAKDRYGVTLTARGATLDQVFTFLKESAGEKLEVTVWGEETVDTTVTAPDLREALRQLTSGTHYYAFPIEDGGVSVGWVKDRNLTLAQLYELEGEVFGIEVAFNERGGWNLREQQQAGVLRENLAYYHSPAEREKLLAVLSECQDREDSLAQAVDDFIDDYKAAGYYDFDGNARFPLTIYSAYNKGTELREEYDRFFNIASEGERLRLALHGAGHIQLLTRMLYQAGYHPVETFGLYISWNGGDLHSPVEGIKAGAYVVREKLVSALKETVQNRLEAGEVLAILEQYPPSDQQNGTQVLAEWRALMASGILEQRRRERLESLEYCADLVWTMRKDAIRREREMRQEGLEYGYGLFQLSKIGDNVAGNIIKLIDEHIYLVNRERILFGKDTNDWVNGDRGIDHNGQAIITQILNRYREE